MPLYVVATPIGNDEDLSPRAARLLSEADLWVVEEMKNGRRLAKRLGVFKEMIPLNEHNEAQNAQEALELLLSGKNLTLTTDAGTPGFADPGARLVELCHQNGVEVVAVPGPSSLSAALSLSGLPLSEFYYAGFLPRSAEERRVTIRRFAAFGVPVVLYDTPYRIKALVTDLMAELGPSRPVRVFFSLTQEDEETLVSTLSELDLYLGDSPKKREFVLVVEPSYKQRTTGGVKTKEAPHRPAKTRKSRVVR
ncbi:MAG: SAM-dependent methyltransferase [bacterium]|nr:SAM-dependent methyltransferase [bacterium]